MFFGTQKRNQVRALRLAEMFGGSAGDQHLLMNAFRSSFHFVEGASQSVKYRINVFSGGLDLQLQGFYLPEGIAVSLNRPYSLSAVREPVTDLIPGYGMQVFRSTVLGDPEAVKLFLKDNLTLAIVRGLNLSRKERLYIGTQHVSLLHLSKDDDLFRKRFDDTLQLVLHHAIEAPSANLDTITSRYTDSRGVTIDPQKIPERLRKLLPLARQWAIGDDGERQRYRDSVSADERKALVDAVAGLRDEIEQWSMQHRGETPVPDEVVLFDMMSEAVAEVESEFADE